MSVVGFDIGTDTCFISIARQGGIEVVANEFSYRHNSTLVSFNQRVRFLGENGKSQLASNVQNTIFGFPLLIARDYNDPDVQETLAMLYAKHCRLDTGAIGITVKYNGEERTFEPVQLLAMLLVQLKAVAESNLKTKVVDCVISCPIFFNDAQRRAMLVASHIAGLNCLRLFNETSAVALTYGIYKKDLPPATEPPRLVAFVDMGKKAFKASICSFSEGKLTVLATVHDSSLGGQNLDRSLFDKFATEFKDKYKIDVHARPKACVRLLAECENRGGARTPITS